MPPSTNPNKPTPTALIPSMPLRLLILALCLAVTARADDPVSFRRDIAPLLQRRCATCHNEDNPKGGYRLDTVKLLRTTGDSGDAPLVPGKPKESHLFDLLTTADKDDRMPQKADALPAEELALIERWIAAGAMSDADRDSQSLAELARQRHLRAAPPHYPRPIPVTALAFDSTGTRLATSGYREVLIWDVASGTLVRRLGGLPERITSLAWHEGRLAFAGGTPGQWGTVGFIFTESDFRILMLCDLQEMALSVAFSPNGKTLVAGCGDRTLRVFRTLDGAQRKVLRLHADWVQSVAFAPNGKHLVTASRDRTARVLDTTTWETESSYNDHDTALLCATYLPDGNRVVSMARGGVAHLWRPEPAERRGEFIDTGGEVRQLASGPFGLAAGGADGTLRLYQEGSRTPWLELPGHHDAIQAVTTTRDGDLLATASADGEVIIWSAHCWEALTRFLAVP